MNLNYYNRRWLRERRGRFGKPTRYHLGEPAPPRTDFSRSIWAYCGLTIVGAASEDPFELCPRDCDESMHCTQCTKSLMRRIEGRRS